MIQRQEYMDKLISFREKQLIKVITGIRRCGKSTLLELYREYLKNEGVTDDQIISVNFENVDFEYLQDYKALYQYIDSRLCNDKYTYVFLDEIQNCKYFEKAIDSIFIKKNVDVYLTGSNAYILSGELATLLSGRYVEISMLPLSFKEYMSFFENRGNVERRFVDYIRFGGFPYVLQLDEDESAVYKYLEGIYNTVLVKDVIKRYGINDIMMLESVARFLFGNVGNIVSTKKISDTLTTEGRKTNTFTVERYLSALKNSFILYEARRYDIKGKQHLKSLEKYYVADVGLRNYLLGYKEVDTGHILENVVYLELIRRGYKVTVGKVADKEVDFVAVNQYDTIYIQVSESVRDASTFEREMAPLRAIKDNYPKLLLTRDVDINSSYDGIKRVNVLDYLLGKEF